MAVHFILDFHALFRRLLDFQSSIIFHHSNIVTHYTQMAGFQKDVANVKMLCWHHGL
jgi:hypothetical protein